MIDFGLLAYSSLFVFSKHARINPKAMGVASDANAMEFDRRDDDHHLHQHSQYNVKRIIIVLSVLKRERLDYNKQPPLFIRHLNLLICQVVRSLANTSRRRGY